MNKILLTGGAGFVGSHVADAIVKKFPDAQLYILDKMSYVSSEENLKDVLTNPKRKLIVGDITNFELCLSLTKNADLVLHLAAESHVDNSFSNSIDFTKSNTLGTHTIIEACKANKVSRIIHISTDEVYGFTVNGSFLENSPLNPTNPYSASKAAAEMIINSYIHSYNLPIITVRANNMYGPRQYPEKIIPKFSVLNILNKKLTIHGTGKNVRTYLSVYDFAEALMLLIDKGVEKTIYNIGTHEEFTNLDIAKMMTEIFNKKFNDTVEFVEDRPFNDKRYSINFDKILKLGWAPKRKLIEEISGVVDWYKQNYLTFNNLQSIYS